MKILDINFKQNTVLLPEKSKKYLYGYTDDAIASAKLNASELLSNKEIKNIYKVACTELFAQRLLESFFIV